GKRLPRGRLDDQVQVIALNGEMHDAHVETLRCFAERVLHGHEDRLLAKIRQSRQTPKRHVTGPAALEALPCAVLGTVPALAAWLPSRAPTGAAAGLELDRELPGSWLHQIGQTLVID